MLGTSYQKIEIHEDQWDDIVNDALMFYTENIEGGQVHKAYALSYNGELKLNLKSLIPNVDIYSVCSQRNISRINF